MKFIRYLHIFIGACLIPLSVNGSISSSQENLQPLQEHARTTAEIISRLRHQHFQRTQVFLDDQLSSTVLDRYIEELDRDRSYFLASDIEEFEQYRHKLDDAFKTSNLQPAYDIYNRYQLRVTDRLEFMLKELKKGINKLDFKQDEYLTIDRKQLPWAKSLAELDQLWRKRLKNAVLSLKLTDKKPENISELLIKRYENQLNRVQQIISEDAYRMYMNALTLSYDPHTQYFSPRATENFNIRMKLSLEGIGAMLQLEDEYTKVTRVIPAGPADKAGQLKANDRIIGVGQGENGELVDVIGWRLDDVVDLIRGPKDSIVRLSILQSNAVDNQQSKVIAITRDTVKLEEQAASKKVIELGHYGKKYKLGIIDIPKFYIDFEAASRGDPNYRSTTRDVRKL
ncbi:MAG: PDZ domain-containing protein, partial [Gammaproteobacteria bacterium]|nr:PDZ domain-containing protein [Gammaproteobacteria bacterium]